MSTSSSDEDDYYGPKPPPHLIQKASTTTELEKKNIGPQLPPGFIKNTFKEISDDIQPTLKGEHSESEEEDDEIGPMPFDHPSEIARKPAPLIKQQFTINKREEWMLVPPKNKEVSGLASRKFLARTPDEFIPDKPGNEPNEEDEEEDFIANAKKEMLEKTIQDRDEAMERNMEGSAKKRKQESLLEIHRKKLKSESLKEQAPKERREFDRDQDLKVSGMTSNDKERYIARSKEYENRFKKGKQKFL